MSDRTAGVIFWSCWGLLVLNLLSQIVALVLYFGYGIKIW